MNKYSNVINEDLLEDFMTRHNFSAIRDEFKLNVILTDNIGKKRYGIPMSMLGDKQQALKIMCLVVELRNMKENWGKEKGYHKRRKIYSKMNYIKGELNRYED